MCDFEAFQRPLQLQAGERIGRDFPEIDHQFDPAGSGNFVEPGEIRVTAFPRIVASDIDRPLSSFISSLGGIGSQLL